MLRQYGEDTANRKLEGRGGRGRIYKPFSHAVSEVTSCSWFRISISVFDEIQSLRSAGGATWTGYVHKLVSVLRNQNNLADCTQVIQKEQTNSEGMNVKYWTPGKRKCMKASHSPHLVWCSEKKHLLAQRWAVWYYCKSKSHLRINRNFSI